MADDINQSPQPLASRTDRKNLVYIVLSFCAAMVLYILFKGTDSTVYQTIVTSSFSLVGWVLMVFMGSNTYADIQTHQMKQTNANLVSKINSLKAKDTTADDDKGISQ